MNGIGVILGILFSTSLFAKPLPTTPQVDVGRYVGKWYAHYSLPQFFTRNCRGQTAEYEVINERKISVLNTCLKRRGVTTISGQAVVLNPGVTSRLEVTFDNFFTRLFRVKGDYTIIKLDPDYEYVLVGSADRKSLWLMSRSDVAIPDAVREEYLGFARELGFNTGRLVESRF